MPNRKRKRNEPEPDEPLQGGTFQKVDQDRLRADIGGHLSKYVDLKVAALESQVAGEVKGLEAKLDNKPSHASLTGHTIAVILALLALLAFGGDRFTGGMSATGALAQTEVERKDREADLDKKIDILANEVAQLRRDQGGQKR